MNDPGVARGVRLGRKRTRAVLLLGVIVALLIPAAPAWAHAQLQATTPAGGSRVKVSPSSITLQFGEAVEITPQSVQVFDARGKRVDAGAARHPAAGATWVVAPLRTRLPDGTYAVAWRAVSDDTHPVRGSFTFVVGNGALGLVSAPGSAGSTELAVGVLFAVARWVVFGGLALLVGGAVFLLLCWPGGRVDLRATRLLWGGWAAVSAASFLALVLQGPYTRGEGLLQALTSRSLGVTLTTRFGAVLSLRLLLLGLAAIWLTTLLPRWQPAVEATPAVPGAPNPAVIATGAVLALGLLVTWPATGHPAAGSQVALATPVDAAHLAAMCVWLGGLAVLALTLMPVRRGGDLARALPVFSRLAFSSVIVLLVTGTYQSWRQVGTLPAFTGTTYGRLLLVKLAAFVALIALGNLARVFVRRHYDRRQSGVEAASGLPTADITASEPALVGAVSRGTTLTRPTTGSGQQPPGPDLGDLGHVDPEQLGRLRRSLLVELLIGVAVLALTAVLVASAPARDTYHPPARATLTLASGTARVVVTPARAGQDLIDLRLLDKAGRPLTAPDVRGSLSLPSRQVSELRVTFERVGPGHYTAGAAEFPFAGRWQLALTVRTDAFDEATATTTVRIR